MILFSEEQLARLVPGEVNESQDRRVEAFERLAAAVG
jgi:hypothetical protein